MRQYLSEIIFASIMVGAIVWMVIGVRRGKKLWRPKDPRSIVIIKITLWAGLLTWMVFILATSLFMARIAAIDIPKLIEGTKGIVYSWVVPIWIIFTILMLIWAVARFASRKLRSNIPVGKKLKIVKEVKLR
jgi:hypothetical protein